MRRDAGVCGDVLVWVFVGVLFDTFFAALFAVYAYTRPFSAIGFAV